MAKDHYVPQLYLRNFHTSNSKGLTYRYKKEEQPVERSIAKQVGCEESYYSIDSEIYEQSTKNTNDFLYLTENKSKPILNKIITNRNILINRDEKLTLSYFIAALATRTPLIHEFFKKQVVDDTVLFIKSFALDTDDFIEFAKQKEEDFSGLDIEEIRQLLLEPEKNLQISVDDTEDNNKSIIRGSLSVIQSEFLARRLFLYHWQLLLIESESFFITSDNPVVFLDPISPDAFLLKKCPVFLPISPKFAILIHPWQFASDKLFIEDDLVNFYVKKSLIFAKDFVFSHIKSREIQNLLDETKQNINELNYQYVFFSEQKLKFLLERKLLKI